LCHEASCTNVSRAFVWIILGFNRESHIAIDFYRGKLLTQVEGFPALKLGKMVTICQKKAGA